MLVANPDQAYLFPVFVLLALTFGGQDYAWTSPLMLGLLGMFAGRFARAALMV